MMIVKCDRCEAKYRLDETKIPGKGARITCPRCGNIFIILKEDLERGEERGKDSEEAPAPETKGGEGEVISPEGLDLHKAGIEKWRIKTGSGMVYNFTDIPTMKKFILSKKLGPADSISHNGKVWKSFREIPRLDDYILMTYSTEMARINEEKKRQLEIQRLLEERRKRREVEERLKEEAEEKLLSEGEKEEDGLIFDISGKKVEEEVQREMMRRGIESSPAMPRQKEREEKRGEVIPFRAADGTIRSSMSEAEVTIEDEEEIEEPAGESTGEPHPLGEEARHLQREAPTKERDRPEGRGDARGGHKGPPPDKVAVAAAAGPPWYSSMNPWMIGVTFILLVILGGTAGYLINELSQGDAGTPPQEEWGDEIELPPLPPLKGEKGVEDVAGVEEDSSQGTAPILVRDVKERMKELYPMEIRPGETEKGGDTRAPEVKREAAPPVRGMRKKPAGEKVSSLSYGDINPDELYHLALESLQANDSTGAIEILKELVKIDPGNREYQSKLAEASIKAGAYRDAMKVLNALIKREKGNPAYLVMMGDCCLKMGETASAREYYERYLEIEPQGGESDRVRVILRGIEK